MAWQMPALAGDTFYSGSAVGLQGTAKVGDLSTRLVLAENYMSCDGTPNTETVASMSHPLPVGVRSKTVTTFTVGRDGTAVADTKVEDFRLDLPGLNVVATAVASHSEAHCDAPGQISTSGKSTVTNLNINGKAYAITGKPNQSIPVGDIGTVIVNQQIKRFEGDFTSFRTVALRVRLLNSAEPASADIAVASSKAKIFCD